MLLGGSRREQDGLKPSIKLSSFKRCVLDLGPRKVNDAVTYTHPNSDVETMNPPQDFLVKNINVDTRSLKDLQS